MQRKPVTLLRAILAAFLSTYISSISAQDSLSGFEQALKETGWSVQQNADGSLILGSPESPENTQERSPSTKDQWPQLQHKLQSAGWSVEREADGSLLLAPPEAKMPAKPKTVPQTAETGTGNSFDSMQQKLRDTGWRVINGSDGGILLYPPDKSHLVKPLPCPGTAPTADVVLPVDSWQEAHDIVEEWLSNQSPYNASVGKIRKILNIYLVSIVSEAAPFNLIQQVAIRSSDGTVIVLN